MQVRKWLKLYINCICIKKKNLGLSQELAVDWLEMTRGCWTHATTIAMIGAAITDKVTIVNSGNSALCNDAMVPLQLLIRNIGGLVFQIVCFLSYNSPSLTFEFIISAFDANTSKFCKASEIGIRFHVEF